MAKGNGGGNPSAAACAPGDLGNRGTRHASFWRAGCEDPTGAFLLATSSLLLLSFVGIAAAVDAQGLAGVAMLLYFVVGIGSAGVQTSRQLASDPALSTLALGFFGWAVVGLCLVELHIWAVAVAVLWILVAISAVVNGASVIRSVRDSRAPIIAGLMKIWRSLISQLLVALLTAVGSVVCIVGALLSMHLNPNKGGLTLSIFPAWDAGIAVILVAVMVAYQRRGSCIAVPIIALVIILGVTPSIVYDVARDVAAQKHVGVVGFFIHYGRPKYRLDIYQSWPGFFAGVAWIIHGIGGNSAETVARWWPGIADLAGLVALRRIGDALGFTARSAWLAAAFFSLGDSIGQDYFSPQSFAYICCLILLAIAIRPSKNDRGLLGVGEWCLFVLGVIAIATSHQLTPYLLFGFLVILGLFQLIRSYLLPAVVLVPSLGWATVHWAVVRQYFTFGQVGHLAGNLSSPSSASHFHYDLMGHLATVGVVVAPAAVGMLGLAGIIARRDRQAVALALCGASPLALLVLVHYGNEDVFRAVLFSIPWWGLLAARAASFQDEPRHLRRAMVLKGAGLASIPIVFAGYVLADTGNDYVNVVHVDDLAAEQAFETTAAAGSHLIVASNIHYIAVRSTFRYPLFQYFSYSLSAAPGDAATGASEGRALSVTLRLEEDAVRSPQLASPVYILGTEQGSSVGAADGLWSPSQYRAFFDELSGSRQWRVVFRRGAAELLEYVPSE